MEGIMLVSRKLSSLAGGFHQLGLNETLIKKLTEKNIVHPTEIQSKVC